MKGSGAEALGEVVTGILNVTAKEAENFPFDITVPVSQPRVMLSETKNRLSLTPAASMNRRGAGSKFHWYHLGT